MVSINVCSEISVACESQLGLLHKLRCAGISCTILRCDFHLQAIYAQEDICGEVCSTQLIMFRINASEACMIQSYEAYEW